MNLTVSSSCGMPPETLLVTGGCRSGKSRLALEWALRRPGPRAFLATAEPLGDPEMEARVARHQTERGPEWLTLEAPLDPVAVLMQAAEAGCGVALFDCVTVWVSNLMMMHDGRPCLGGAVQSNDEAILAAVRTLADVLRRPPLPMVLVTDEVGQGVVPESALGRRFRDLLGETNQLLAAACSSAVLSVCGIPIILKGEF